jgi:hypothetical protein
MSNSPTLTINNSSTSSTITSGGPFGSSGSLTLTNNSNEHEQLSVADIRRFKEMCELLDYIASVDPKFREYMTAFKAKQRILR